MKLYSLPLAVFAMLLLSACQTGFLENMSKDFGLPVRVNTLDNATIVKGLKEALSIGTDRAVRSVAVQDGYYGNQAIRILMPEKVKNVADLLSKVGFQRQVDEFVVSMNRAAEKAAPKAATYFVAALKEMTFEDARKILYDGGNTAATEYFRQKTGEKIHNAFKPVIAASMNQVGTTRAYKDMMAKYTALPFTTANGFDLDRYVTTKAVDGLFSMLGEEEKRIRTEPAARATELLRKVFGR